MESSSLNVKNNSGRGDFYFRDVYQRNTYASFKPQQYCDQSTIAIADNDQTLACTSQISTFDNGVGSLHVYTRNNADFDKTNAAVATVSINPLSTILRSTQTNVSGVFTVGASLLKVGAGGNVGIKTATPTYTLDVNGDCNLSAGSVYRINGAPVLSSTTLGPSVTTSSLTAILGELGKLTVNGNVVQTSGTSTLQNVAITGTVSVNGSELASSVAFENAAAFVYTGPGESYLNGVPFFSTSESRGTAFVTASGTNNNLFTFSQSGTYMLQAEIQMGYPWLPEGDTYTYYVKNGNASVKYGCEQHHGTSFACTRPYFITVGLNDTVRFLVDSSSANEYEMGIERSRLMFVKIS